MMFFDRSGNASGEVANTLENLDAERIAVDTFIDVELNKQNAYPIYHWVRHRLTNGDILEQPESEPTTNFDEFLVGLDALRHSSSMSSLAPVTKEMIAAQLREDLSSAKLEFADLNLKLSQKKVDILQSNVENKFALVRQLDELKAKANERLVQFQGATEEKLVRLEATNTNAWLTSTPSASPSF